MASIPGMHPTTSFSPHAAAVNQEILADLSLTALPDSRLAVEAQTVLVNGVPRVGFRAFFLASLSQTDLTLEEKVFVLVSCTAMAATPPLFQQSSQCSVFDPLISLISGPLQFHLSHTK
jgi:hypothetical protein